VARFPETFLFPFFLSVLGSDPFWRLGTLFGFPLIGGLGVLFSGGPFALVDFLFLPETKVSFRVRPLFDGCFPLSGRFLYLVVRALFGGVGFFQIA